MAFSLRKGENDIVDFQYIEGEDLNNMIEIIDFDIR